MSWSKFFKAAGKALAAASATPAKTTPKAVPLMTMDMIQSDGGPITTAQAIKLFKEFALKSGYLAKDELTDHTEYFSDQLTAHAQYLEEEAAGDITDFKAKLKNLKAQRKSEADKNIKEQLDEEIADAQEELDEEMNYRKSAILALAAFKADKRQFLIDYMNQQTQGR